MDSRKRRKTGILEPGNGTMYIMQGLFHLELAVRGVHIFELFDIKEVS